MRMQAVAMAIFATTGVGCSGGDSGGGGVTIDGGVVGVYLGSGFTAVSASFYSDISPKPASARLTPTDECELQEAGDPGSTTITYLDVGAEVEAVSGSTTVVASRDTSGGAINYFGLLSSVGPANATYSISVAGSADLEAGQIAEIFVPDTLTIPLPAIVPGESLTLEWTATGADSIFLLLGDAGATVSYYCSVEDDGTFVVPGEVTQAVGADGGMYFGNTNFHTVEVNGRTVLLVGGTQDAS